MAIKGQCLCGAVKVTATTEKKHLDACHCSMCRTWSGGPFMAMGCGGAVEFEGEDNISRYVSSEWAERLFCKQCGTSLAWGLREGGNFHVSASLFKETDSYPFAMQVFIDEKPDNYSFAEDTQKMTGAELFALFAPDEEG